MVNENKEGPSWRESEWTQRRNQSQILHRQSSRCISGTCFCDMKERRQSLKYYEADSFPNCNFNSSIIMALMTLRYFHDSWVRLVDHMYCSSCYQNCSESPNQNVAETRIQGISFILKRQCFLRKKVPFCCMKSQVHGLEPLSFRFHLCAHFELARSRDSFLYSCVLQHKSSLLITPTDQNSTGFSSKELC